MIIEWWTLLVIILGFFTVGYSLGRIIGYEEHKQHSIELMNYIDKRAKQLNIKQNLKDMNNLSKRS